MFFGKSTGAVTGYDNRILYRVSGVGLPPSKHNERLLQQVRGIGLSRLRILPLQ